MRLMTSHDEPKNRDNYLITVSIVCIIHTITVVIGSTFIYYKNSLEKFERMGNCETCDSVDRKYSTNIVAVGP